MIVNLGALFVGGLEYAARGFDWGGAGPLTYCGEGVPPVEVDFGCARARRFVRVLPAAVFCVRVNHNLRSRA
jgi:hypothetical protein